MSASRVVVMIEWINKNNNDNSNNNVLALCLTYRSCWITPSHCYCCSIYYYYCNGNKMILYSRIRCLLELNLNGKDFLVKLGRKSGQNLKWENNPTNMLIEFGDSDQGNEVNMSIISWKISQIFPVDKNRGISASHEPRTRTVLWTNENLVYWESNSLILILQGARAQNERARPEPGSGNEAISREWKWSHFYLVSYTSEEWSPCGQLPGEELALS